MSKAERASPSPAFIAVFWAAIVGGLILSADIFVALPDVLALVGAILFLGSVLAVFVLSAAAARKAHDSFLRSLGRGLVAAVRWFFDLLPA